MAQAGREGREGRDGADRSIEFNMRERERERETTGTKRVIDLLGFFPFFLSFSLTRFPLQLRLLLTNEGGLDSFHSQRSPFDVAKEDLIITLAEKVSFSGMPVRASTAVQWQERCQVLVFGNNFHDPGAQILQTS